MSVRERQVLKVIGAVKDKLLLQKEAARLLELSTRQVRRLYHRVRQEGDIGVIHRLRGRPSNRRIREHTRAEALKLYERHYMGFGPTLASEKLLEREGIVIGRESLRRLLVEAGLWQSRRRREKHRQRRERRACFGEMTQGDGSRHDWLEGRGPAMTLLVLIDDATSKAVARFYPAETTLAYMDLLRRYMRRHGLMQSLYTDRHSIFWGEELKPDSAGESQLHRALGELGIDWIPAYSPQAKGRVERFMETAQDRLVKELRLAGANTLPGANEVLERTFLRWFNQNCTVKAACPYDAHREVPGKAQLDWTFSERQERLVANDYTVRYRGKCYQILPPALPGLRGGRVELVQRMEGPMRIYFRGQQLRYAAAAGRPGAPPPNPRSLANGPMNDGGKKADRSVETLQPASLHRTLGHSGRTPALPCPAEGGKVRTTKPARRPAPDHPWRNAKRTLLLS